MWWCSTLSHVSGGQVGVQGEQVVDAKIGGWMEAAGRGPDALTAAVRLIATVDSAIKAAGRRGPQPRAARYHTGPGPW